MEKNSHTPCGIVKELMKESGGRMKLDHGMGVWESYRNIFGKFFSHTLRDNIWDDVTIYNVILGKGKVLE